MRSGQREVAPPCRKPPPNQGHAVGRPRAGDLRRRPGKSIPDALPRLGLYHRRGDDRGVAQHGDSQAGAEIAIRSEEERPGDVERLLRLNREGEKAIRRDPHRLGWNGAHLHARGIGRESAMRCAHHDPLITRQPDGTLVGLRPQPPLDFRVDL